MKHTLRIGFLVNPFAGVGGPGGYKGSDGEAIQLKAARGELALRAPERASVFLAEFLELLNGVPLPFFVTCPGAMGENVLQTATIPYETTGLPVNFPSRAEDSKRQLEAMLERNIDLLLFIGGDGTARDVCSVLGTSLPVLGIPSGVKMHSGVFAVTPQAAAKVAARLIKGELTALGEQEVRDIDEQAFRQGVVKARYFGEMLVPDENTYVQHVKQGGMEVEELVLLDMAAELKERIEECDSSLLVIFGPGSTTLAVQRELGCEGTLLGVDTVAFEPGQSRTSKLDANAENLKNILAEWPGDIRLVITAIGGQGHILGRGNQQLDAEVLRKVGKSNIWLVASKTKLESLQGRPLIMDSSDPVLDREWGGLITVICGYRDCIVYPLGLETVASYSRLSEMVVEQCKAKLGMVQNHNSRRLFHGRGRMWQGLEWCCVDYFSPCLLVTFFRQPPDEFERILLESLELLIENCSDLTCLLIQRRYASKVVAECINGVVPEMWQARRGKLGFLLSHQQQNVGFFLDMEPARAWLEGVAAGKKILNLFSYTCAFSVVAAQAGAESVVNIDMSKKALETGRENHRLNQLSTPVKYLAHDIFKSWGRLKREGPYDLVIIDPPSYQKGSFIATKDYQKVLKKLSILVSDGGLFLACLNAPEISCTEFESLIAEFCSDFSLVERLENSADFPDVDRQRALKMLVYKRL